MNDKEAKTGMKFVLGFFVYGFTTLVVLLALGFWWAAEQFTASGPLQETRLINIERGTGLNGIAAKLKREKAIESPPIFVFGTRILGAQGELKAGEYELTPGISPRDIMKLLHEGKTVERHITVREGLTSFEIVRLLKTVEELSGDIDVVPPEGSLLPNTYDFQLNEPRSAILQRLESNMASTIIALCKIKSEANTLSFSDLVAMPCGAAPLKTVGNVLTLASIVEKETAVAEERKRVAGVFINRLKRGIPLQTDPTAIYAITKGKHENDGKGPLGRRLLRKDLEIDSPYNTYKYPGLPPGPIANPGRASIEAVLNPEDHDYIYFVADGSGGHAFAKTLKEHNANVTKWRKIRNKN